MLFFWYMFGALLNVLFRWSGWKRNNADKKWGSYWKRDGHLAYNIQNLIVTFAFSFVWVYGLLGVLVGMTVGKLFGFDVPEIERGALSSIAVGFVMEILIARASTMLGKK